jgi:hypothetical protein
VRPAADRSTGGRSALIERKPVPVLCLIALGIACVAAAYQGILASRDLTYLADEDFARDIAAAESIAAGHPLSDPVYRGEWIWYNPLAPTIVAVAATISHRPIPLTYSRLGAYFNVLIPLSLFVLVVSWWGWMRALVTVLAFLYLVPADTPGWVTAGYSPWLYPMHVGQAMFYVALFAMTYAWRTGRAGAFALAGFALGTTLLAHTAPVLLLSGAMLVEIVRAEWRPRAGRWERLFRYLVFAGAAVVAAAPLLISIVGHYHLHIRNAGPGVYVLNQLGLNQARELWSPVVTPSVMGLVTLAGFVRLVSRRHELESRLLLSVISTAGAFLMYGYLAQTQWAASHGLITVVPTHHFWYYLTVLSAIVFAYGVGTIADGIRSLQPRMGNRNGRLAPHTMTVLTTAVVLTAVLRYPAFTRRVDFRAAEVSRQMFSDPDLREMYEWLRRSTERDDVFTAPVNLGQSVIGMSGRKVVVVSKFFSNPYVDWGTRAEDNLAMDRHLRLGDFDGFLTIASKYRVRYIARLGRLPDELLKQPLLSVAWSSGSWVIYKVGR